MNGEKKITEKSTCQLATTTTMKYGDDFEEVATWLKERKEKEKKQDKTKRRKCVLSPG